MRLMACKGRQRTGLAILLYSVMTICHAETYNVGCKIPYRPKDSQLTIIGSKLTVNGTPMAIYALNSRKKQKSIMQFYQRKWEGNNKPHYILYSIGKWKVIAHMQGACFYTVQLQPNKNGTEGLIGVSLPNKSKSMGELPSFPSLAGTKTINNIHSDDDGKKATTWYLGNRDTVNDNINFYRSFLSQRGWGTQIANHTPKPSGAEVLEFQKKNKEIEIVVSPAAFGSTILINEVTH